jgi:hypothetical protein
MIFGRGGLRLLRRRFLLHPSPPRPSIHTILTQRPRAQQRGMQGFVVQRRFVYLTAYTRR